MKALGLELYSPDDPTSAMVTAFTMPDGLDGQQLYAPCVTAMAIVLAGGQGKLRGRIMRIGHMGYMNEFDIVTALAGLELALGELGYRPPAAGAGVARVHRGVRRACRLRVLVNEQIAPAGVELLRDQFQVDVDLHPLPEALAGRIGAYDALIVRSATSVSAELIEHADRLKVIGRAGTGVDNVDVAAATRRGIIVANAPGSNMVAAAEHALGLLLAIARNIPQAHAALTQGRWERKHFAGVELADKVLGIVGLRAHRPAGRRPCAGVRHAGRRVRPVRVGRSLPRAPGDVGIAREPAAAGRLHHPARAAHGRDAAPDRRRRHRPDEAGRAHRERRPRRPGRPGCAGRRAALGSGRGSGARCVPEEPYTAGAAARAAQRRRDAAPGRVDPGGAGPGGRDRRRAGGGRPARASSSPTLSTSPRCRAEEMELLGPFLPLAPQLGRLATGLCDRGLDRIDVIYSGGLAEHDTRLAHRRGAEGRVRGPLRRAGEPGQCRAVAESRGIAVAEAHGARRATTRASITVATGEGQTVSGTTIGREYRPWLVEV